MVQLGQAVLGIYGVLLIAGGVMGKVKAGSSVSLGSGVVCGLVSLWALYVSRSDPAQGFLIGGMLALLVAGVFLSRFVRTRKLFPAGAVLLLSGIVAAVLMWVRQHLPTG